MSEIEQAIRRLEREISRHRSLLVAFSGGVDSALVAAVGARVLGQACVAVTAVSASLPDRERQAAREFCRQRSIAHVEVATDELEREAYAANGADRCYHCKSALFDALAPLRALTGAAVALGTNLDDLGDHRPGIRAAKENGAVAPLVDAGFTKAMVRQCCQAWGLTVADKPAAACLSSRVAYGDRVTPQVLARVEQAENALKDLGFGICRVRAHASGALARVEVPVGDLARATAMASVIDGALKAAGFSWCSLDLAGFVSGSMNVVITPEALRLGRPR